SPPDTGRSLTSRGDRSALDVFRARERGAGSLHLLDGALRVARLDVDAANRILDHDHVEAPAARVEHALLDAVVGREPGDVEPVDAARPQQLAEPRVLEGGVALAAGVLTLVDHDVDLRPVEAGMELRAVRSLDAV